VYGELLAGPGRAAEFLDVFLNQAGVAVDWETSQELWTVAGTAFHRYAMRRRSHRDAGPRRLLADFIIGAHALLQADRLLTFDTRVYRTAFPPLVVISA
jgi:predicted nucleic acid-binding protein